MASLLLACGLVLAAPGRARASSSCDDPRIHVRGTVDDRWLEPLLRACETLRAVPDTDRTATVRIVGNGPDLVVDVVLTDGRSTLRRVHDPADLARTLEALLATPPTPPSSPPPPPEPNEMPPPEEPRRAPSPSMPTFGVEAGLGAGGRIAGNGYESFAPELYAHLSVDAWLLGASARWDVVQLKDNVAADLEMETIAAAITFGRRTNAQVGDVDLGVALRLLSETQSFESNGQEKADSQTDVRFGVFGRFAFGKSKWRPYVALDAELSPTRLRRALRIEPDLPALPAWSAGLALGISWGDR